jgi:hypothetical protein
MALFVVMEKIKIKNAYTLPGRTNRIIQNK